MGNRFGFMAILVLVLAACSRGRETGYLIDDSDPDTRICLQACHDSRNQCFGQLARAFQACVRRYPGNTLDQQDCYRQQQNEVLAKLQPKLYPNHDCDARFDACFVNACGGRIDVAPGVD